MKNFFGVILFVVLFAIAGYIFFTKNHTGLTTDCDQPTCSGTETVATSTDTTTTVATSTDTSASSTKSFYDAKQKVGFDYTDNFYFNGDLTNYVSPVEWPPQISISTSTYTCKTSGKAIDPAGQTISKKIGNNNYCLTIESEGAAGSTYTTYTYKRIVDKKVVSMTFIDREPQCMNFDEPKQSECKTEEANFDIDGMMDKIFATVVFK